MTTKLDDAFLDELFRDLDDHAFDSSPLLSAHIPTSPSSQSTRRTPLKVLKTKPRSPAMLTKNDKENVSFWGDQKGAGSLEASTSASQYHESNYIHGGKKEGGGRKRDIKHVEISYLEEEIKPSPLKRSIGKENHSLAVDRFDAKGKGKEVVVTEQVDYDDLLQGMDWNDDLFASQEPGPIPHVSILFSLRSRFD
jgi:hypothetical protein